jgi:hypothetical protein
MPTRRRETFKTNPEARFMFWRKTKKKKTRRRARGRFSDKPLEPVKAIAIIVEMRQKAHITYSKLSTISGVDKSYMRRLERGESRNPGRDTLIDLARSLVNYTKLFTEKDVDRVLQAAGFAPAPMPR